MIQSVNRNYANTLLLSGGLDSSILAFILKPKYSLTVSLGENAPDLEHAKAVAAKYSKSHTAIVLTNEKLLQVIEQVIITFKSFDPMEIRNSSVILAGLEAAHENGHAKVMTGDGGDELFAGYNYLRRYYNDIGTLDVELHKLWQSMHFSSLEIGKRTGVDVKLPFLDNIFVGYAKSIATVKKIGEHAGEKWGKFILRRCFEAELGKEIAWRPKFAQEQGAGISNVQGYIENNTRYADFLAATRLAVSDGVKIRNKEHLYYYSLFRRHFLAPKDEACSDRRCPDCKGCFRSVGRFCRICGAFPVLPI